MGDRQAAGFSPGTLDYPPFTMHSSLPRSVPSTVAHHSDKCWLQLLFNYNMIMFDEFNVEKSIGQRGARTLDPRVISTML